MADARGSGRTRPRGAARIKVLGTGTAHPKSHLTPTSPQATVLPRLKLPPGASGNNNLYDQLAAPFSPHAREIPTIFPVAPRPPATNLATRPSPPSSRLAPAVGLSGSPYAKNAWNTPRSPGPETASEPPSLSTSTSALDALSHNDATVIHSTRLRMLSVEEALRASEQLYQVDWTRLRADADKFVEIAATAHQHLESLQAELPAVAFTNEQTRDALGGLSREIQTLYAQQATEKETLLAEFDAASAQQSLERASLVDAHAAEKKALDESHTTETNDMKAEFQRQIRAIETQSAAVERNFVQEMDALKLRMESELQSQIEHSRTEKEQMEQRFTQETDELRSASDQAYQQLLASSQLEIGELKSSSDAEIERLLEASASTLAEVTGKLTIELHETQQRAANDLASLTHDHAQQQAELKHQYDQERTQLLDKRDRHAAELRGDLEVARAAHVAQAVRLYSELTVTRATLTAENLTRVAHHRSEVLELNERHTSFVSAMTKTHKLQVETLTQRHADELQTLERATTAAQEVLMEQHAAQLTHLRNETNSEKDRVVVRYESELDFLRRSTSEQLETSGRERDEVIQQLREAHIARVLALETTIREHDKCQSEKTVLLEEEISEQKHQLQELEASELRLQEQNLSLMERACEKSNRCNMRLEEMEAVIVSLERSEQEKVAEIKTLKRALCVSEDGNHMKSNSLLELAFVIKSRDDEIEKLHAAHLDSIQSAHTTTEILELTTETLSSKAKELEDTRAALRLESGRLSRVEEDVQHKAGLLEDSGLKMENLRLQHETLRLEMKRLRTDMRLQHERGVSEIELKQGEIRRLHAAQTELKQKNDMHQESIVRLEASLAAAQRQGDKMRRRMELLKVETAQHLEEAQQLGDELLVKDQQLVVLKKQLQVFHDDKQKLQIQLQYAQTAVQTQHERQERNTMLVEDVHCQQESVKVHAPQVAQQQRVERVEHEKLSMSIEIATLREQVAEMEELSREKEDEIATLERAFQNESAARLREVKRADGHQLAHDQALVELANEKKEKVSQSQAHQEANLQIAYLVKALKIVDDKLTTATTKLLETKQALFDTEKQVEDTAALMKEKETLAAAHTLQLQHLEATKTRELESLRLQLTMVSSEEQTRAQTLHEEAVEFLFKRNARCLSETEERYQSQLNERDQRLSALDDESKNSNKRLEEARAQCDNLTQHLLLLQQQIDEKERALVENAADLRAQKATIASLRKEAALLMEMQHPTDTNANEDGSGGIGPGEACGSSGRSISLVFQLLKQQLETFATEEFHVETVEMAPLDESDLLAQLKELVRIRCCLSTLGAPRVLSSEDVCVVLQTLQTIVRCAVSGDAATLFSVETLASVQQSVVSQLQAHVALEQCIRSVLNLKTNEESTIEVLEAYTPLFSAMHELPLNNDTTPMHSARAAAVAAKLANNARLTDSTELLLASSRLALQTETIQSLADLHLLVDEAAFVRRTGLAYRDGGADQIEEPPSDLLLVHQIKPLFEERRLLLELSSVLEWPHAQQPPYQSVHVVDAVRELMGVIHAFESLSSSRPRDETSEKMSTAARAQAIVAFVDELKLLTQFAQNNLDEEADAVADHDQRSHMTSSSSLLSLRANPTRTPTPSPMTDLPSASSPQHSTSSASLAAFDSSPDAESLDDQNPTCDLLLSDDALAPTDGSDAHQSPPPSGALSESLLDISLVMNDHHRILSEAAHRVSKAHSMSPRSKLLAQQPTSSGFAVKLVQIVRDHYAVLSLARKLFRLQDPRQDLPSVLECLAVIARLSDQSTFFAVSMRPSDSGESLQPNGHDAQHQKVKSSLSVFVSMEEMARHLQDYNGFIHRMVGDFFARDGEASIDNIETLSAAIAERAGLVDRLRASLQLTNPAEQLPRFVESIQALVVAGQRGSTDDDRTATLGVEMLLTGIQEAFHERADLRELVDRLREKLPFSSSVESPKELVTQCEALIQDKERAWIMVERLTEQLALADKQRAEEDQVLRELKHDDAELPSNLERADQVVKLVRELKHLRQSNAAVAASVAEEEAQRHKAQTTNVRKFTDPEAECISMQLAVSEAKAAKHAMAAQYEVQREYFQQFSEERKRVETALLDEAQKERALPMRQIELLEREKSEALALTTKRQASLPPAASLPPPTASEDGYSTVVPTRPDKSRDLTSSRLRASTPPPPAMGGIHTERFVSELEREASQQRTAYSDTPGDAQRTNESKRHELFTSSAQIEQQFRAMNESPSTYLAFSLAECSPMDRVAAPLADQELWYQGVRLLQHVSFFVSMFFVPKQKTFRVEVFNSDSEHQQTIYVPLNAMQTFVRESKRAFKLGITLQDPTRHSEVANVLFERVKVVGNDDSSTLLIAFQ